MKPQSDHTEWLFRLVAVAISLPVPGVLDSLEHPCVQPVLRTWDAHSTASLWAIIWGSSVRIVASPGGSDGKETAGSAGDLSSIP